MCYRLSNAAATGRTIRITCNCYGFQHAIPFVIGRQQSQQSVQFGRFVFLLLFLLITETPLAKNSREKRVKVIKILAKNAFLSFSSVLEA